LQRSPNHFAAPPLQASNAFAGLSLDKEMELLIQQAGNAGQFLALHGVAASCTAFASARGESSLVLLRLLFNLQTLRWFVG